MFITIDKINTLSNVILVDIREEYERESFSVESALSMPMAILVEEIKQLSVNNNYVLFCQSGNRSGNLVKLLKSRGHCNFYSLEGGANLLSEKNYK